MGQKRWMKHTQSSVSTKVNDDNDFRIIWWLLGGAVVSIILIGIAFMAIVVGDEKSGVTWTDAIANTLVGIPFVLLAPILGGTVDGDGGETKVIVIGLLIALAPMWIAANEYRKKAFTIVSISFGVIAMLVVGLVLAFIILVMRQPVDIAPNSPSVDSPGIHNVKGHWRGGKWIDGYQRSNPDGIESNNLNK